jgi:hypothetical protein
MILGKSVALEGKLQSATSSLQATYVDLSKKTGATLATARDLNSRSRYILSAVDQNLYTTRTVGAQATKLGALTAANAVQTRAVGSETRKVGKQAGELQIAAAQSLHGIEEVTTRFTNIEVVYEVTIPISDPRLSSLAADIVATIKGHPARPATYVGVISVADILPKLPKNDAGRTFLEGLDVEIEMYRPPFPAFPYYGDSKRTSFPAGKPDFDLRTEEMRSLAASPSISNAQVSYGIQWTATWNGSWNLLSAFASGFLVPMVLQPRTGRLDSLADLPGSLILIHLIPEIFQAGPSSLPPGLTTVAVAINSDLSQGPLGEITGVALNIDGEYRRFAIGKARKGVAPLFKYDAIVVPRNWRIDQYFIP